MTLSPCRHVRKSCHAIRNRAAVRITAVPPGRNFPVSPAAQDSVRALVLVTPQEMPCAGPHGSTAAPTGLLPGASPVTRNPTYSRARTGSSHPSSLSRPVRLRRARAGYEVQVKENPCERNSAPPSPFPAPFRRVPLPSGLYALTSSPMMSPRSARGTAGALSPAGLSRPGHAPGSGAQYPLSGAPACQDVGK